MSLLQSNEDLAKQFHQCDNEREAFELLLHMLVEQHSDSHVKIWKRTGDVFRLLCQTLVSSSNDSPFCDPESPEFQSRLQQIDSEVSPVTFEVSNSTSEANETSFVTFSPLRWQEASYIIGIVLPSKSMIPDRIESIHELLVQFTNSKWLTNSQRRTISSGNTNRSADEQASDDFTSNREGFHDFSAARLPASISDYVYGLHQSLDPVEAASHVANETRRFIGCDRVSVLLAKGTRFCTTAISGQASVNHRSNLVMSLTNLANVVLRTKSEFRYPHDSQSLAPQMETALEQHLSDSGCREIVILPIFESSRNEEDNDRGKTPERVIGGMVLESIRGSSLTTEIQPSLEIVKLHAANALRNAIRHRRIFLYPVWNRIGITLEAMTKWSPTKTIFGLVVIGLFLITLLFAQGEAKVRADGQLIPKMRSNVFAEIDGKVSQINVVHGQQVHKGETLLVMQSEELDARLAELSGRLKTLLERIKVLELAGLNTIRGNHSRAPSMPNNLASLRAELSSLREQESTLHRMKELLVVKSPIDGQVLTWDPHQRLSGRPIKVGERLIEVAQSNGPWQIELQIPERRAGKVLRAQQKPHSSLPVEFVLASDPGNRYEGSVSEIAATTKLSSDRTQVILAYVDFQGTPPSIEQRQVRSSVIAKVHCGRTSLALSLLGDLIEFIESEILFRLW